MINRDNSQLLYKEKIDYFTAKDNYFRKKIPLRLETLIFMVITYFFSFYAVSIDLFEKIIEWSQKYEHHELDEFFLITFFLALAFGFAGHFNFAVAELQKIEQDSDFYPNTNKLLKELNKN